MRPKKSPIAERRTVGYARCSTDGQSDSGVTLQLQEAKIRAYADALDWPLSEVIQDAGESAASLKRPGMQSLLASVRRGEVERIVCLKLDRLTRSVRDLAELFDLCNKHDTALVSIQDTLDTSTAGGRMVTNMLAVVAQWELEVIRERTEAALTHKRRNGIVYGRVPFGYVRAGDQLHEDPNEQRIRAEAIAMDRAGKSFREIGRFLTSVGARNKVWAAASVRSMLRSRMVLEAV